MGGDAAQDFEGVGRDRVGAWTRLPLHELVEQLWIVAERVLLVDCEGREISSTLNSFCEGLQSHYEHIIQPTEHHVTMETAVTPPTPHRAAVL